MWRCILQGACLLVYSPVCILLSSLSSRQADGEIFIENVEPEHETCGMTDATIRACRSSPPILCSASSIPACFPGEHEEITKVKNVNFIELGRFRMETWCEFLSLKLCGSQLPRFPFWSVVHALAHVLLRADFSPLPKEYWKDDVTETVRGACLW